MKTKNYYAYPAHKTGYTRGQHALLRRGEVLVIDHDGLVGRGCIPEELYRAWGTPDFYKRVVIRGYDVFHGWGEEYGRGTCLIYGTPGTVREFALPDGLTLEDYVNYYERLTYDSFKVTREGYSACVITQGGVLPLVKWWTEADEDLQVKSFHTVEDARAFLETL